jgi:hypothetical protein
MKRYVALFLCLFSLSVAAQQPARPKAPAAPQAPAAPAAIPAPPAPPSEGQLVNIRLDVSVIDQEGTGVPKPKTLMVILADMHLGQTRAVYEDRSISVDARPTIADGLIRVNVTVKSQESPNREMMPVGGGFMPKSDPILNWTNSFTLLLSNGKPMVALETSDAVTKRKLSIEVKATIQK